MGDGVRWENYKEPRCERKNSPASESSKSTPLRFEAVSQQFWRSCHQTSPERQESIKGQKAEKSPLSENEESVSIHWFSLVSLYKMTYLKPKAGNTLEVHSNIYIYFFNASEDFAVTLSSVKVNNSRKTRKLPTRTAHEPLCSCPTEPLFNRLPLITLGLM